MQRKISRNNGNALATRRPAPCTLHQTFHNTVALTTKLHPVAFPPRYFAPRVFFFQFITVSDATGGSFIVTLDLTADGGPVQTSGEIAYNADATGGRTSVQGILEVGMLFVVPFLCICQLGSRSFPLLVRLVVYPGIYILPVVTAAFLPVQLVVYSWVNLVAQYSP